MPIPTIQGIAGILTDPKADSANGKPLLKLFIGMSDRKLNQQTNQWETGKQFAVEAVAWEDRAERFAQGLSKGDQVYIEGRIEIQQWEKDGQKHSKPVITLNTLRRLAPAQQMQGGGFGGQSQQQSQQQQQGGNWNAPANDPWGSPQGEKPAF